MAESILRDKAKEFAKKTVFLCRNMKSNHKESVLTNQLLRSATSIGANLHEGPSVPNFGMAGKGPKLMPGMTIAVEPMVNFGKYNVYLDAENNWTFKTLDHSLSAHYENTIVITEGKPEILTLTDAEMEAGIWK